LQELPNPIDVVERNGAQQLHRQRTERARQVFSITVFSICRPCLLALLAVQALEKYKKQSSRKILLQKRVCELIVESLQSSSSSSSSPMPRRRIGVIAMESFYRVLSVAERESVNAGEFNFDHPGAFEFPLLEQTLRDLRDGKNVKIPRYDLKQRCRCDRFVCSRIDAVRLRETDDFPPYDVILVEGILLFHHKSIADLLDIKVCLAGYEKLVT
jgi:uridine kinase